VFFIFADFLFHHGYSIGVPTSCFHEFKNTLSITERYCSVLPEVWQGQHQINTLQAAVYVPHRQLFIVIPARLVLYDNLEWCNIAYELSSI
jgi:hypothetical protein